MHYINGAYTNYVNRKRNRSGHLFQGRYKAILIDQDSYLLELSRYIHMNPVRANIVNKPEEYRNSSYKSFEWKAEDILNSLTSYFNLDSKEQLIGKKSCRDIGIYLMKKHTGLTNRKIGELIGGLSYAAVSKAYHRFDIKLKGDKSLVKVIKKLEDRMSHV